MMGVKFSTLKSILTEKRSKKMNNKITLIDTDKEDVEGNEDTKLASNEDKGECSHHHFENIYNTNSSSSGGELHHENYDSKGKETESAAEKGKNRSRRKGTHEGKKKKNHWILKFNCAKLKNSSLSSVCSEPDIPDGKAEETETCVCTGYRRTEGGQPAAAGSADEGLPVFVPKQQFDQSDGKSVADTSADADTWRCTATTAAAAATDTATPSESLPLPPGVEPVIDLEKFNPENYPIEDCDEEARLERAREIAEGVNPPPGFSPKHIELVCQTDLSLDNLTALFQSALSLSALSQIDVPKSVHTQIDYIHCLVPDLLRIASCSFYWGKMDRYEAERLLENKPQGTFLLRDSAQEEYLFSVSFRKYDRSLHARIEQWNHRFSFDSHDPGVFASPTVCGLIEHYKDPTFCMFFEPVLTTPLHRNFPFSLQHLCRAVICDCLNYDAINYLKLPKSLKTYLKEYHYKQRVRVRKFDADP